MEKIRPVVAEKYEFEYRDKSSLLAHLKCSHCQDTDVRNKIDNFSSKWFATIWELPIGVLVEEIEGVVIEK